MADVSLDSQRTPLLFVFVHGLLGFDQISLGWTTVHYFRGLPPRLRARGFDAVFPRLPRTESIETRARALAQFIARVPGRPLCLVGHSMGGLDSRYLIHNLDPAHRVRCLVTVGTPHRGSPLASWFMHRGGALQWVGRIVGGWALPDLTPDACVRFNEQVPDRADVRYLSYAGVRPVEEMPLIFRPSTRFLQKEAGENDGQVGLASAKWGDFQGTVRASHTELNGWSFAGSNPAIVRPFDHVNFYLQVLSKVGL